MNRRLDELMQSVLDGEATPEEATELDHRLAADAAARGRFEELGRLFQSLREVPKAYPPEGLVASVLANIPQNRVSAEDDDQPFVASGVIRASSRKARVETPGTGIRVSQVFQRFARGRDMNEQKGGLGGLRNRKVWIGGGVAVAAAIVAIGTGLIPPNSSETAGTIVPAQRYQATPISATDVKLGTPEGAGAGGTAGAPNTGAANAGAANEGAGNRGAGNRGAGNEGAGNRGAGNEGAGNRGAGNDGAGNRGAGNEGAGNRGAGNEGAGNRGAGNEGAGNRGAGNDGAGNRGAGNEGAGNRGAGNEGAGNRGAGNMGAGNMGAGNMGAGNMGAGNMGAGNMGAGNMGAGNMGAGNRGAGNLGAGNMGAGNMGAGNRGAGANNAQVQ